MWRLFRHRSADAPSGGQTEPAPTAPTPQGGIAPYFLTEQVALAAIADPDKAVRLNELIRTTTQATIDKERARTENQKEIQDAHGERFRRGYGTVVAWTVGGLVVLSAAVWGFGIAHALKGLHLPVPRSLVTVVGTVAFGLITWAGSTAGRKIYRHVAGQREISEVRARFESARSDTVVTLPNSRQDQSADQRGSDPTQADVS